MAVVPLLTATVAAHAQPAPQEPAAVVDGVTVPADAPASPQADAVLERILRSGCRDGLPEARALAGNPSAPWADTVARLCGDILSQPSGGQPQQMSHAGPGAVIDETASANEGRGRLVLWSSLYGIWLGIAGDVLLEVDDSRTAVVLPMLGLATTLTTALVVTSNHPVTTGQAWTIITGLDYASANGALWGAAADLSTKGIVGVALGTSVAATAVATWVAATQRPKAGDIELVRSALLWGTAAGLLGAATFRSSDTGARAAWASGAIAMDLGLVAGIGLANTFELSRNRVLMLDAGAIGGGLAGFGISWLIAGGTNANGRAITGATLGGLVAGIAVAALATRTLDSEDAARHALTYPAVLARDADGRWSLNVPSPSPVLDRAGSHLTGASVAVAGGLF
ncbi:MAG TPA: hypothetical protein VHM31_01430 [Polyangia bacterium]|nr:hypothetical protein [Polyangia bacterium]